MGNRDLVSTIASSLNRSSDEKVAYFLNDGDSPSEVDTYVPTGSTLLDTIIANRENGGVPVGKIVEINGLEGSGKSLLANHILANTQKMGGVAVLIDTENAVDSDFLDTIGIDRDGNFLYISEHRVEKIFQLIEKIVAKVKEKGDRDKFVTIVVDSVAGATTENEVSNDFNKEGYNTDKAIVLSMAMRKITNMIGRERVLLIFTNQVRHNVGVMYGDPWTTSGGKAIPFHSSVRIRMRSTKKIRHSVGSRKEVVGVKIRPHIIKNRLGPPERTCEFDLYFSTGIDDLGSWFEPLKDHDFIEHKSRGWYYVYEINEEGEKVPVLKDPDGPDEEDNYMKVQEKTFTTNLEEDPAFREKMKRTLMSALVRTYDQGWVDRDNIEYVEKDVEDDE